MPRMSNKNFDRVMVISMSLFAVGLWGLLMWLVFRLLFICF